MRYSFFVFRFILILVVSALACASAASWRVIEQPQYQLIFDESIEAEAQRVANLMDAYLAAHLNDMPIDTPIKQTPIVLYHEAHISNGNVALFPYRSRWYNQPALFARMEWFDVLAVHEGRHMVQFNQFADRPLGKALSFAFGEVGPGLLIGLLPTWFLEGDAVLSETLYTEGGRGRVASFDLWLRTDALNHRLYSYERAVMGTGFDRTPYHSPYVLGYFLTSHQYNRYGKNSVENTLARVGSWSDFFFYQAFRAEHKVTLRAHYYETFTTLRQRWQAQIDALNLTDIERLTDAPQDHWRSDYPIHSDGNQVIAVTVDVTRGFFLTEINNGTRRVITNIPRSVAASFYSGEKTRSVSSNGTTHCWVDETPHHSHPFKSYGELFCFDEQHGLQKLTKRTKFTSVLVTDTGFLVHEFNEQRESRLIKLNQQGQPTDALQLPVGTLAYDFTETDEGFLFVLLENSTTAIYQLSATFDDITTLVSSRQGTLRSPTLVDNLLIYSSDKTGIDQLMGSHLTTGESYQLVTRPYGSYYPIVERANDRLVFSDYTPKGQQLAAVSIKESTHWIAESALPAYEPFLQVSNATPPEVNERQYPSAKYRPSLHLIRPHSWSALATNNNVGGILYSQNVLETLALSLAAGYQLDYEDWYGTAAAQYRTEWGPTFLSEVNRSVTTTQPTYQGLLAIAQPFQIKHGSQFQTLIPALGVSQTWENQQATERIFSQLQYSYERDRSFQNIRSPLYFSPSLYADVSSSGNWRAVSNVQFSTTGFGPRQAFDINLNAEWKDDDETLLSEGPLFDAPLFSEFTALGAADYRMNLGATDIKFGPVLYWKNSEISANTRAYFDTTTEQIQSAIGSSFAARFNLFRNPSLILNTQFSLFYLPQDDEAALLFSVALQN